MPKNPMLILTLLCALNTFSQPKADNMKPKIIVGMVIDQMRWDYLYRYSERFGEGGFKRLMKEGFNHHNTFIPYSPSVTAAGHASIFTGAVPAMHGIIGNDWMERKNETYMYCTTDTSVRSIGGSVKQGQMSPRNLRSTTIGDELRIATNFRSRVYGIALKDRGAIVTAGQSANAAYWFDDSTGNWITSSYYMHELPAWVKNYNNKKKVDSLLRTPWNLLYDSKTYRQSTADDVAYERTLRHEKTRTFPHDYTSIIGKTNYYGLRQSPFGNTLTIDFAEALLINEQVGKGDDTDMFCLSLSSTDYIGHTFGPNSMEVEDMYLRLDKDIERFLNFLDKHAGIGNYLFFLTSDHGAPNVPLFMKDNKMNAGSMDAYKMVAELNKLLENKFRHTNLVKKYYEFQFFLDLIRIDSLGLNATAIKKVLVDYLIAKEEVRMAFSYDDMYKTILTDHQRAMLANGYYPDRSGDIHVILEPQYTDYRSIGIDHGSIYNYDTHIPLIWYGWNVKPGSTHRKVNITDIAPTVAALLKIQMPNSTTGEVLEEIVK